MILRNRNFIVRIFFEFLFYNWNKNFWLRSKVLLIKISVSSYILLIRTKSLLRRSMCILTTLPRYFINSRVNLIRYRSNFDNIWISIDLLILKAYSLNLTSNYCIMMTTTTITCTHCLILGSHLNVIAH